MSNEVAKRGRKPLVLDKAEFQRAVTDLETAQSFPNRTLLWKAVEESAWAKALLPRPLTAQVALLKADEMGILIQTPKGKRGRSKGDGPVLGGGRKKKFFDMTKVLKAIPPEEREALKKTIEKAANGSVKARIKLNCLDCSNWQKGEVAHCQNDSCPMWEIRPYKRSSTVLAELAVV